MGTSLFVTIVVAIPVGILAAVKQYSWADKIITTVIATIGYALPSFVLGLLLRYIFAQQLDLFPLFGMNTFGKEGDILDLLWHLFLPVLTPHDRGRRRLEPLHAGVDARGPARRTTSARRRPRGWPRRG